MLLDRIPRWMSRDQCILPTLQAGPLSAQLATAVYFDIGPTETTVV